VDEIKNYTGYSRVGVQWAERGTCNAGVYNNGISKIGQVCLSDAECTDETGGGQDGTCQERDVVAEGFYPFSFANEVGDSGGQVSQEIVPNWDFEDSRCTADGPRASVSKPCITPDQCQTISCNADAQANGTADGSAGRLHPESPGAAR